MYAHRLCDSNLCRCDFSSAARLEPGSLPDFSSAARLEPWANPKKRSRVNHWTTEVIRHADFAHPCNMISGPAGSWGRYVCFGPDPRIRLYRPGCPPRLDLLDHYN